MEDGGWMLEDDVLRLFMLNRSAFLSLLSFSPEIPTFAKRISNYGTDKNRYGNEI